MASTCFRMIGVALFVVALSALEEMQWDGGPADKASITACVGGIASIPWSFVKGDGDGETLLSWWFKAPGKEKTYIATSINGHFYTTRKETLTFLPNAGLSLRDARPQDSGDYSVQVQLLQAKSTPVIVKRTMTLSVTVCAFCRSPWSEWSSCQACDGISTRTRKCNTYNPACKCSHGVETQLKDCVCSSTTTK